MHSQTGSAERKVLRRSGRFRHWPAFATAAHRRRAASAAGCFRTNLCNRASLIIRTESAPERPRYQSGNTHVNQSSSKRMIFALLMVFVTARWRAGACGGGSIRAEHSRDRAVFLLAEAFDDDYFFGPAESPVMLAIGDDPRGDDFADAGQPG